MALKPPTLTVRAVKNIVGDEMTRHRQKGRDALHDHGSSLIAERMFDTVSDKADVELDACKTYEDLDQYLKDYYNWTLYEWAESL